MNLKFKKLHLGLPRWLNGKLPTCQCRRCRLDPWVGKTPLEEEMANPLQYSCPEYPMDRGAWKATVHGVAKELNTAEQAQA